MEKKPHIWLKTLPVGQYTYSILQDKFKNYSIKPGMMAYICNPSYLGNGGRRIMT
jgi:hypothetical protein